MEVWNNEILKAQWEDCLRDGWDPKKNYVFISYASRDWPQVYPMVLELRQRGINVYIDTELKENQTTNWMVNVKKSVINLRCRGIITFLSINYMRSYACLIEQLINHSDVLNKKLGRRLPIFYYALQKEMCKVQDMRDHIYDPDIAIESEDESAKILSAESTFLQELITTSHFMDYQTPEAAKKLVDGIENKHDVATTMYELIFDGDTKFANGRSVEMPSITLFTTAENCTDQLMRNFTNDKNDKINLEPNEDIRLRNMNILSPTDSGFSAQAEPEAEVHVIEEPIVEEPVVEEPVAADPVIEAPAPAPEPKPEPEPEPEPVAAEEELPAEPEEEPAPEEPEEEEDEDPEAADGKKAGRGHSLTGDITYTLYGQTNTANQANMMVHFFAQVLKRHPEKIATLPQQRGMNCVSAVDYSDPKNKADMPPYFRSCQFLRFPDGQTLCVGTSFSSTDKYKKMAALLAICGESADIFSSEQVELPVKAQPTGRGKADSISYRVYSKKFVSNQTDMLGNIVSQLLARHPDKLDEAAEALFCLALEDYSKVEAPSATFNSCNVYELDGRVYTVGGGLGMKDKLRQISRLLAICNEEPYAVEIAQHELEVVPAEKSGRGNSAIVRYSVFGEDYEHNQTDMLGNIASRVLARHPDKLEAAVDALFCMAFEDYRKIDRADRPNTFNTFNTYTLGGRVYSVGGGLGMKDKLTQISRLLAICGEALSSVSIEGYELKAVSAEKSGRGNADSISYSIFGADYESNQTDMLGSIVSQVLARHPDKLDEAAEALFCVALEDYSKVEEHSAIFNSCNVYELGGRVYSVGGGLGMKDKLRQAAKLLILCNEPLDAVTVEGQPLEKPGTQGRRKAAPGNFMD